jgi:hypothetical protein
MNIFILDNDIELCAQYHCDKHVVKMITEYAQQMSTVMYINDMNHPYEPNHLHHPCVKWVGESLSNFKYLIELGKALYTEYKHRYGDKIHKAGEVILNDIELPNIPDIGLTPFALAMPEQYMCRDAVKSYRQYYIHDKLHILSYKNRQEPQWLKGMLCK